MALLAKRAPTTIIITRTIRHDATAKSKKNSPEEDTSPVQRYRRQSSYRGTPTRYLTTLDPRRLTPSEYFDISNLTKPSMRIIPEGGDLSTMATVLMRYTDLKGPTRVVCSRFPPNSKGFFYLYAPQDEKGRILPTAQLRFRLLDSPEPERFSEGTDLLQPTGEVWAESLAKLFRYPTYQPLLRVMVQDGSLPKHVYDRVEQLVLKRTGGLNRFDEEFFMDFGMTKKSIGCGDKALDIRPRPSVALNGVLKYSGTGVVRLERASPDDYNTLVMRVMEVLTPPNPEDKYFQKEGELLKWYHPTDAKEVVWYKKPRYPIPRELFEQLPIARAGELHAGV
ncbi:hypothetical protein FA15DRAFT_671686 [Coprinopsis marcescibilis]|uniref:Uncharacterized protein n=1 Tax=Coprinopsis marcescibilis TaxID=230819 RepID=A0A5C3KQB6_COPMA|nr:hypothetical protein FA15DRAFT_671686 [Coprinopsis marcescibilis]